MSIKELQRIKELNANALLNTYEIALPKDFTTDIPLQGRLWLYKGSISETTWKEYGLGYSKALERVILPVYRSGKDGPLLWYQCRAILEGQQPKYIQPSASRDTVLFKSRTHGTHNRCVITEDILSAIRVGKHTQAYSLLGTKITTSQANYLSKYDEVITWLDPDKAGVTGAYNIRKALQLITNVRNIVTDVDPKNLSDEQIKEQLND